MSGAATALRVGRSRRAASGSRPAGAHRRCEALPERRGGRIGTRRPREEISDPVRAHQAAQRHLREADLCVSFAADLVEAAATGTGLAYGGKSFTSAELKDITTSLDVYVFPCVNPDGRRYSMVNPPSTEWRKNRNPASSGGDPKGIGVDINRNYDFLWDFAK